MANNIPVSSNGTTGKITVTADTTQYWSQKSREWATSGELVDREDYSSKYYAQKSQAVYQQFQQQVDDGALIFNNPFFLGLSQYFENTPNNLSWLKSEGQWNSKAVYPGYYDWILENVNNGIEGFKGKGYAYIYGEPIATVWITTPNPKVGATVYSWEPCHKIGTVESITDNTITFFIKEINETVIATRAIDNDIPITNTYWITDYDFVINTTDETFKLPLLNGSEKDYEDSYINTGLTKQGDQFFVPYSGLLVADVINRGDSYYGWKISNQKNVSIGFGIGIKNNFSTKQMWVECGDALTFILKQENVEVKSIVLHKAKGNGSLYFYAGETTQNANLIDAGELGEVLSTKTDISQAASASLPSTRYIDLTLGASGSFYTAPSDGWVLLDMGATQANQVLNVKIMKDGILTAGSYLICPTSNGYLSTTLPVTKGAGIRVVYNLGGNKVFKFIYAQGAK